MTQTINWQEHAHQTLDSAIKFYPDSSGNVGLLVTHEPATDTFDLEIDGAHISLSRDEAEKRFADEVRKRWKPRP
jgi:hypothetical protein